VKNSNPQKNSSFVNVFNINSWILFPFNMLK
jgi:hypothetical protein